MKLKINAFILLCLSVIAIAVSSCDSDKEESACDEQNYNRVVRLLHTEDGRELFPEISGSDLRFVGFQSPDIAKGFVSGLVAREWDGTKSISCDFHEYGTMKVSAMSASSDGIYGNIYFNLKRHEAVPPRNDVKRISPQSYSRRQRRRGFVLLSESIRLPKMRRRLCRIQRAM